MIIARTHVVVRLARQRLETGTLVHWQDNFAWMLVQAANMATALVVVGPAAKCGLDCICTGLWQLQLQG
jgi:hypothetical protein